MKFSIEYITPQQAKDYLESNVVNRNISSKTVDKYANDMKNGAWQLNGQPIVFSKSGELRDGQHRLAAIVKSGTIVPMAVVRGVEETVSVYDIGRNRSVLDSLIFNGYDKDVANPRNMAVARLDAYIQHNISTLSVFGTKQFLDKHRKTLKMLSRVSKMCHKSGVNLSSAFILLPMMYAVESGEDINKIYEFAEVMNTGFYNSNAQTSAIVIRNDILLRKIPIGGGAQDRKFCSICVENAIHDFCTGKPRKKTYSKVTTPIYSCIKEDEK